MKLHRRPNPKSHNTLLADRSVRRPVLVRGPQFDKYISNSFKKTEDDDLNADLSIYQFSFRRSYVWYKCR